MDEQVLTNARLYEALAQAQKEIKNAKFNKVNPHFKNKYADISALRDAYQDSLSKYGLSLVQILEPVAEGMMLITKLCHKSGESVESKFRITIGTTDTMQSVGSKITYARRYSAAAIIGIGAEEDDDAEAANGKGKLAPEQLQELNKAFNEIELDKRSQFTNWAQVSDLSELTTDRYEASMKVLASLRGKK